MNDCNKDYSWLIECFKLESKRTTSNKHDSNHNHNRNNNNHQLVAA